MSGKGGTPSEHPCAIATARFVELSNKGARELGFADTGVLWRSNYDMPADAFAAEVDRLWTQVRPLYVSLHTYVRSKLAEKYGAGVLPDNGMLPAHLLGNMWAQDWTNIYPLVAPPASGQGYDLTAELKRRNVDERGMVRYAERFFTSLGYQPLPPAFWERSLFTKPADREVVCHASASGWGAPEDVRIKMCIEVNAEDFQVVHHELGHNYYQLLYARQPYLYRDAAIDAFHEAIGDLIALSATPGYLKEIGLIDQVPSEKADLEYLLKTCAQQSRIPAVQRDDRSVALEGVLRRGLAGRLQQSVVGPAQQISGHRRTASADGRRFRSGRQVPRAGETRHTRAISSPTSCSFSSIGRSARKRDSPARCTAARFTEARRRERSSRRCSRWAAAGRGPRHWRS